MAVNVIDLGLGRYRKLADETPGTVCVAGQCLLQSRHPSTERSPDPCAVSASPHLPLVAVAVAIGTPPLAVTGGTAAAMPESLIRCMSHSHNAFRPGSDGHSVRYK